jgi:hypothetical protein
MQDAPKNARPRVEMLWAVGAALATLLLIGCERTTAGGSDAGCISYAEARLSMPRADPLPTNKWGDWIADTDDRMTGTCRR